MIHDTCYMLLYSSRATPRGLAFGSVESGSRSTLYPEVCRDGPLEGRGREGGKEGEGHVCVHCCMQVALCWEDGTVLYFYITSHGYGTL